MKQFPGRLFLVVGSSGVGKDSVMDGARARLAGNSGFEFQRRVITRAAMPDAEDHDTLSVEAFEAARVRGDFSLSWQAHGLWYGVPREIEDKMAAGRTVIVNTSRMVITAARTLYPGTQTVHITASPETLVKRLSARGRETADDIAARLARNIAPVIPGEGVWQIENDGDLSDAVSRFVDIVEQFERPVRLS